MSGRLLRRLSAAAAALGLIAIVAAPYWNLERYRREIQAGLERELHRRVTAGKVRLELLGGPGVSLADVIIEDDPRAGREPFAYVTSLEARIALRSLWSGKLEFASLRLIEPSVNLVRPAQSGWNFLDLVSRPPVLPGTTSGRPPAISVRDARINFKFGDTKSVLYLANADVDLEPPASAGGAWQMRFSGEPARTDRPARGLGRIAGRGQLDADGRLALEVAVERTYLEEISTLLAGRDLGLRGQITSRASLQGPVSALRIAGDAQLRDFRRWDLLPPLGGDWRLRYSGTADLLGQHLQLEAAPEGAIPLKVQWDVTRYLSEPDWKVEVMLKELSAGAFFQFLRVLGMPVPPGLRVSGAVSGAVTYAPQRGWQGTLEARDLVAETGAGQRLRCPHAPVLIEAERVRMGPWRIETPGEGQLSFEGAWSTQPSHFSGIVKGERVPSTILGSPLWPGLTGVPVLASCNRGAWTGTLRLIHADGQPARWTGRILLRDAEIPVAGLASPVTIEQAELGLAVEEIHMKAIRGSVAGIRFEATCVAGEGGARPTSLEFRLERLDLAELERLLAPCLDRRRGVLARALPWRRAPAPGWLLRRRVEGRFEASSIELAGSKLTGAVTGRLTWDGLKAVLRDLHASTGDGNLRGRVEVDLRGATPAYTATLAGGPLEAGGGRWWIEGWLETEGVGEELSANLRASGVVLGRDIPIAPGEQLELLAARFNLRPQRRGLRLSVEALEAVQRDAVYRGEVKTEPDGRLVAELAGEHRQLRLEGTLWPLKLVRVPSP